MANKDDYLTYYREFFENFAQTVNPNDQLPVKLASYKLVNVEVVGGIIDWTTQYLTQKKCPPNLVGPLIKIVIEEIRKACKKHPISCGFNTADNAYEPLKLMQTVMAKTNEVCLRYLDNSMLCSLPSPGTPYFPTSVHAVKNSRRRMEDRHVVINDLNSMFNIQEASPSSYYAVFDGHAGHDAAAYSSAHLHQYLAENTHFISNPEQALMDAFCKTDALFTDKCRVENLTSGTTAVVALLRPKEKSLYVAWVGDSQALLVNQGRLLQIVNPHKPSRQDERERIEKQGGCVLLWGTWRVNGQLAVSRAIGDAEYKPFVIAVPDVREIPLDGGEDFLIIACDGLWDFVTEDQAARTVYNLVTDNPGDIDRISQHLVQLSREQGSLDNISVIVVFLREPSKIAAEAHWANRNRSSTTMEAGLDNANNPFAIPNGAATDNIISQKSDGLLLNLTDNFKQNGTDISPSADFYPKEKSNGKRLASEFDDDDEDFGPETDVDAVDDALSPVETAKGFGDLFGNNNPAEGVCNPFIEHQQEKAALEMERELQKQQSAELEEPRLAREETPTPPADAVHDVGGLVENAAESESEDEWNYIKGDEANKENISPQPEKEVAEVPEEDDAMSQLNPNAAEFIPVSPTRSIPSPACRSLLNDQVISQSPRRATAIDINLPNPVDFEREVKSRPSEVDSYSNGHDESDLMENILNGKNIDEIPEFQPGSTPTKIAAGDEFHFGPNAAPFTPSKNFLDQSEAGLSTKALFGDESTATLDESVTSPDTAADLSLLNKDADPMSMSFYADKGESNPFDLNEVHVLPENLDEFLSKPDIPTTQAQINTINNDDAVQITDLDKQSYDDEKELASPLEPEKELSEVLTRAEECDLQSKTPEPTHENLLGHEFCHPLEPKETESLPRDVELISPEPGNKRSESVSSRPESSQENFESKSPLLEASEVPDLLKQPEDIPRDVELISPEQKSSRPGSSLTHEESSRSPRPQSTEVEDLLRAESKSPALQATEVDDLLGRPDSVQSKSPLPEASDVDDLLQVEGKSPLPEIEAPFCERPVSKSPVCELMASKSPVCELRSAQSSVSESPVCERPISESPVCQRPISESPVCERPISESPVCERPISESPICEKPVSESPVCERPISESPVCERPVSESPVCERPVSESPVCERPLSESPVCERPVSESPVCERPVSESPVCERPVSESPVCERPVSESPVCERPVSESPVCERPVSGSPVCQFEGAASPVCERPASKSPVPELEVCKSPEGEVSESPLPELEALKSPVSDLEESQSPVCQLPLLRSPVLAEPLVCDISSARHLDAQSAEPQAPLTPDFTKEEEIAQAEQHFDLICKSPEVLGAEVTPDFTKTDEILKAQEHFEEIFQPKDGLVSPHEAVTSSLKDEASPITSPIPNEETTLEVDESFVETVPSPGPEAVLESRPVTSPTPVAETDKQRAIPDVLDLNRPGSPALQTLSVQVGEEIDIKTENITPEFAEQAIVTPSEESRQEDVPSAPPAEELVQEPVAEEKKEAEPLLGTTEAVVAAAGVAAVAAAVTPAVAKTEKKKPASSTKKPAATRSAPSKPAAKPTPTAPKTSAGRLSVSPRLAATKTSAAKTPTTITPKPSATKVSPRPRTTPTPAAPKSAERKPMTNGEVKSTVRSTLTSRKVSETATKPSSKPTTLGATKTAPPKPAPARPATTRPATAPRMTVTKTSSTTLTSAAPKPRPTTLAHKAPSATTVTRTTTATKTPSARTSPKSTTAPKPRPPPTTTVLKPRVPLTKTVAKGPDTEKQNKESANKLTASRTVSSTNTRVTSATARSTTTTLRRVESKLSATRTSKTTTTTMKSTTAKKPAAGKAKPIAKPKENGVATAVAEQITTTTVTSAVIENGEPPLLKDNSPVDNKLLPESALVQANSAD